MSKHLFVSFHFARDASLAGSLKTFFQPDGGKCQGDLRFVVNDVSDQGEQAVDAEINRVMSGCHAALFLIGDDTHNSRWIEREAALAISKDLPLVAVRAPHTTGAPPPSLRGKAEVVDWGHEALCSAINRALNQA